MILINLLPHREAARKRRRDLFYFSLGVSAVVGGVIAGLVFGWYQAQIALQEGRNAFLQQEIKRLDDKIKDIANLQQEIASLKARQQAVEDLQADRNMPVHLMNELVAQLPDGTYLVEMRQQDQVVTIRGVAQSQERVAELLGNLANNSSWFTRPELGEIRAGQVALNPREQRRVANFTVRVRLVRPTDAAKAAQTGATRS